jgi:hypothetical protein
MDVNDNINSPDVLHPRKSFNALGEYKLVEIFVLQCHHMSLMDFVVSPPGCGRSVTHFLDWDAQEARLRCPDEVDGDI